MDLSRKTKNLILIGANALFFGVKLLKEFGYGFTLSQDELIWMFSLGAFLLFYWIPIKHETIKTIKYVCLFLLTGTALGTTIGEVCRPQDFFFLEMLWLPFGIAAAAFHYRSSKNDELSPAYSYRQEKDAQKSA